MRMRQRVMTALLVMAFGAGLLMAAAPGARAGSTGRKNTAIGLGALAVYELLRGKGTTGLLAGAAAAYAYKRYQDARKSERRYSYYRRSAYGRPVRYSRYNRYSRSTRRSYARSASYHRPRPYY